MLEPTAAQKPYERVIVTIHRIFPTGHERNNEGPKSLVTGAKGGYSFTIDPPAEGALNSLPGRIFPTLRRRIWEAGEEGIPLDLNVAYLTERRFGVMPDFEVRATDLLRWIARRSRPLGTEVAVIAPHPGTEESLNYLFAMLGGEDVRDITFFLDYLAERGFITHRNASDGSVLSRIRPPALVFLDSLRTNATTSTRAFVAMWFDSRMDAAWQSGVAPAIQQAGYDPVRIDRHEHVNRIDDEIIAQIRQSRFLVADFSSEEGKPRGGVYFEAGLALGLGMPVIWTAKDTMKSEIHFDTRQYNHIFWTDEADLRDRLHNRIIALLGQGPLPVD